MLTCWNTAKFFTDRWQNLVVTNALLLENPHRKADLILGRQSIGVQRVSGSLDEDELIESISGHTILGIRSKTRVTRKALENADSLEAIGAFCIGTNQIDLEAAADCGVSVFNAPYSNTRSVVELAVAEIIALTRRLTVRTERLHQGIWDKSSEHSHEVRGRTLGIIGYGNIGTQLSVLAEALGMRVIFYDIAERLALGNAKRMDSMDDVLRQADVVSIHVDGAKSNANLFGDREFATMKDGALFINLSRGFIVDIDALRKHLLSGHLGGAAVDVFPSEPKANGEPFDSPLLGLENVILTPHVGGSTLEAQEDIAGFVANKLVDYLTVGSTAMSVNLPNLNIHPSPQAHYRVCFLHRNIPGVLSAMTKVFAKNDVNVEGQGLATDGSLGYAITDLNGPLPTAALEQIQGFAETIRVRYLKLDSRG